MKLLYLLFLCVFSLFYTLSCYIPPQLLGSTPENNNNNNNNNDNNDGDDGDDNSTNDRNFCWHRDSCQDTCDSLFRGQKARHQCSELTYKEVNTLAEVSDLLATKVNSSGNMEIGLINSRDLEDIDSKDLDLYLQVGFDSFLEAVEGGGIYESDIKKFMKWVAANEDIAKVIANHDTQHDLGYWSYVHTSSLSSSGGNFSLRISENITGNDDAHYILFNSINEEASIDGSHLFNIDTDDFGFLEIKRFLLKFVSNAVDSSQESFLDYADYEENEAAIGWGHNTLKSFCESISSGHVKQCLQMLYCAHRFTEGSNGIGFVLSSNTLRAINDFRDGIFSWMKDREDIFGRTDVRRCSSDELQKEDRFDNLFNSDQSV